MCCIKMMNSWHSYDLQLYSGYVMYYKPGLKQKYYYFRMSSNKYYCLLKKKKLEKMQALT